MALHTGSTPPDTSGGISRRTLIGGSVIGVLAVVLVVVAFLVFGGSSGGAPVTPDAAQPPAAAIDPTTGEMVQSTTYTTVENAPADSAVDEATDGTVVHPVRTTPVRDAPNGNAIAMMPVKQFGDTWLPVIEKQPGWVHVLLPSKPNGSTGWLQADDVKTASNPYLIRVHLKSMKLDLLKNGTVTDTWKAGTGKESAPTPAGRTFILGAFSDPKQKYSPVILPLGAHSPTHDTFGGGPGTVAIHTWPTADVFGTASSDGCIRVPKDALKTLTEVPLGTLVLITQD
jgi:lipoprotein-anchoring transpeptidase ErfK/SrfK